MPLVLMLDELMWQLEQQQQVAAPPVERVGHARTRPGWLPPLVPATGTPSQ